MMIWEDFPERMAKSIPAGIACDWRKVALYQVLGVRKAHIMLKRPWLQSLLLAGTILLWGCGSDSTSRTATNSASIITNASGVTLFRVSVPPAGGSVTLPTTQGLTGLMTFAPGAAEKTELTLALSTTPPPGAPGDGFYYILMNVNRPFEFSLLRELRIREGGVTAKADEEVRPRSLPNDAELYHGELFDYTGGTSSHLETLEGRYNNSASETLLHEANPRVLNPNKTFLISAKAVQRPTVPVTITNNSGISPAYVTIVGQNPPDSPNGKADPNFYRVTADGKMSPYHGTDRTSVDPLNPKVGWTDSYSILIPEGQDLKLDLPPVAAARMYVTLGRKMQIQINDWIDPPPPVPETHPSFLAAQPDGWSNPADPNFKTLFDWLEFDYKVNIDTNTAGIGINKTEVDMFGFGLQFTLEGKTHGSRTRGTVDATRAQFFADIQNDPDFQKLIVPGPGKRKLENGTEEDLPADLPLRVAAPAHAIENQVLNRPFPTFPNFSPTYFDAYLTRVYQEYLNKDLKCYTSAFGVWFGRTDAQERLVFTCVDGNTGAPLPGFDKIYVRKPNTLQAFEPTSLITTGGVAYQPNPPDGPFVPVPQPAAGDKVPGPNDDPKLFTKFAASEIVSAMSAAMNRTTLLHEPLLTRDYVNHPHDLSKFYLIQGDTTKINKYAKFTLDTPPNNDAPGGQSGGAAYAFGFDDNSNQSSFIAEIEKPTALKVVVTRFKP